MRGLPRGGEAGSRRHRPGENGQEPARHREGPSRPRPWAGCRGGQNAIHGSVTRVGDRGGLGSKRARRTPGQTPRQYPSPGSRSAVTASSLPEPPHPNTPPLCSDRSHPERRGHSRVRETHSAIVTHRGHAWAGATAVSVKGTGCGGGEGSVHTRHTQAHRCSGRRGAAAPTGVGPALSSWGPGCVWEPRAQPRPGAQCPHGPWQERSGN